MTPVNILVVDDEKNIQLICNRILRKEGYEVDCANNGKEALKYLEAKKYNLIISDLKMPELDGHELLKLAKKNYPNITIMLMTAYATNETAGELIKDGALEYIIKPFNIEEFLVKVKKCLVYDGIREEAESIKKIQTTLLTGINKKLSDSVKILRNYFGDIQNKPSTTADQQIKKSIENIEQSINALTKLVEQKN